MRINKIKFDKDIRVFKGYHKDYMSKIKVDNKTIYKTPEYDIEWYFKKYNIPFIDMHFQYYYYSNSNKNSLYLHIPTFTKQLNYIFNSLFFRVNSDKVCDNLTTTIYKTFKNDVKFLNYGKAIDILDCKDKLQWMLTSEYFSESYVHELFKSIGYIIEDNFVIISNNINFTKVLQNFDKVFREFDIRDDSKLFNDITIDKYSFTIDDKVFNNNCITAFDNDNKLIFIPQTLLFRKQDEK